MSQFNLRNFLTENVLTSNSRLLKELKVRTTTDVLYVVTTYGEVEIYDYKGGIDDDDWYKYDGFESNIVLEYYGFDGIGKVVYNTRYSIDDVIEEVERIDEILF